MSTLVWKSVGGEEIETCMVASSSLKNCKDSILWLSFGEVNFDRESFDGC